VLPPPDDSQLILVAEDNSVNQEIIRRQVQHLGYDCVITDNGEAALEYWRTRPFGLLLTDCYMPDMDGVALTQAIRRYEQTEALPRLPIIALTANAMRGEAERCLQAGMDDYLSKPLQLATLRQLLARWLGSPGEVVARLRE
jgi:CheY-like chemotaxis protein